MVRAKPKSEQPGLKFKLHHYGFLVNDIATAAEDLVRRLGYVIESEVIEDPLQGARVQFLRQPEATSWLELISPSGHHSKLANALKKRAGAHHICYEVDDLDRACEDLRQKAMLIVCKPVPAEAFPHRRIAWLMDRSAILVELLERGTGPISLSSIFADPE